MTAAAWRLGRKRATQIGMVMVPRGEVGIVVAQIGLSLHAVDQAIYGVVLFMAVATTLIAPPFLVQLFKDERRVDEEPLMPLTPIS
jgi:Kef-type K+ transport system membrane component KefB